MPANVLFSKLWAPFFCDACTYYSGVPKWDPNFGNYPNVGVSFWKVGRDHIQILCRWLLLFMSGARAVKAMVSYKGTHIGTNTVAHI